MFWIVLPDGVVLHLRLKSWRGTKSVDGRVNHPINSGDGHDLEQLGRISVASSAIFTSNGTRRRDFVKSGGMRFAFPPYFTAILKCVEHKSLHH